MSTQYFRFAAHGAGQRQRSPLLEQLLARADASAVVADWRADAYRALVISTAPVMPTALAIPAASATPAGPAPASAMPGVAAVALLAECGAVDAAWIFIATPVHYTAEMSNVRLAADGILSLSPAESAALAVDFNRVWHDAGVRLLAGPDASLFCLFDQPLPVETRDPADVLGRHIDSYLPTGACTARLRQLMSEIEMWLFDHAVNQGRAAQTAAAVSGLWLWGGGTTLKSLPAVQGWTAGDDPFFRAFSARPDPGCGVVVSAAEPGTDGWRDVESRWLKPALAALRSGRISRLDLSAADRCFSVSVRCRWRFWRRPRPWWEYFE